jgi:hypothetical protein
VSARRLLLLVAIAVGFTLLSTVVQGTRTEYQGWDCNPGQVACPHPMVAVGFPLPYVVDRDGLSPGNSADLMGALLGLDAFRPLPFWLDLAFWLGATLLLHALAGRVRRR